MKDKICQICQDNTKIINYKNTGIISRFLNPQKKILPRKYTSLCSKHQRKASKAIKRSRVMGLMPFIPK
ncbi:30S ribosomal protein S18 [bacterium]|nr:30S ribosomal protein S18 [bacterium]|tara:strand:- start:9004 stop:9210 length:207 start_codon:yes stop_codon:yes gene_type:complete